MPEPKTHRRWFDALWRELTEYGDTTETNYYPYGPLLLQGWIDMAEGMDNLKPTASCCTPWPSAISITSTEVACAATRTPAAGSSRGATTFISTRGTPRTGGAEGGTTAMSGIAWPRSFVIRNFSGPPSRRSSAGDLRLAKRCCRSTKPPIERFQWFIERGIKPSVPGGSRKLATTVRSRPGAGATIPWAGRESGKPFVSFYYDRNNNYMHCCDDAAGRLYEYCVDGAKFLHSSGKYNNRFWDRRPTTC